MDIQGFMLYEVAWRAADIAFSKRARPLYKTAAAQCAGLIGDGHVKIIRSFFTHLPAEVDVFTRAAAEADLADKATQYRPDEMAKYA